MQAALGLGARGQGNVSPNPSVGCIIVKDNVVVGRGWTQPSGRPHAEAKALQQADDQAKGATAYVTLEPCSHYGVTPPCAEALIKAEIGRVVVAMRDPDERVNGSGINMLRQAGINVTENILSQDAEAFHLGFVLKATENRPTFTLKLAVSNDGKIAKANGDSKWITGPEARQFGHMMRAKHDGILVGVNTVLADNPMLSCRVNGLESKSPIRIILDTNLQTPLTAQVVQTADEIKTVIVTEVNNNVDAFSACGVEILNVRSTRDMREVSALLANFGFTSVMIEGGAQIAASFARAKLIDQHAIFRAPTIIGEDGINAIQGLSLERYIADPSFVIETTRNLGPDVLTTYRNIK